MARHLGKGTEQGEEGEDRRMNAYMAGIDSQADDTDDEGEERKPRRRGRPQARRVCYTD